MTTAKPNQFMHFAGVVRADSDVSLEGNRRPLFRSRDMHPLIRRVRRRVATWNSNRLTKASHSPHVAVEKLDGQHRDTQAFQRVRSSAAPEWKGKPDDAIRTLGRCSRADPR